MRPAAVIFAIILFFCSVEIGMRILEKTLYRGQISSNDEKLRVSQDNIRILCLGESTTAAAYFADSPIKAWPGQLESRLNEEFGKSGRKYTVFNEGVPGANSTVILQNLETVLQKYDPHIVIAMIGINDYNSGIIRQEKTSLFGTLRELKIFKLGRFISQLHIQQRSDENKLPPDFGVQLFQLIKSPDIITTEALIKLIERSHGENQNTQVSRWPYVHAAGFALLYPPVQSDSIQPRYRRYCVDLITHFQKAEPINDDLAYLKLLCAEKDQDDLQKVIREYLDLRMIRFENPKLMGIIFRNIPTLDKALTSEIEAQAQFQIDRVSESSTTPKNIRELYNSVSSKNKKLIMMMYPTGHLDYYFRIFSEQQLPMADFATEMYRNTGASEPKLKNLYFVSNRNFIERCKEEVGDCYADLWMKRHGGHFGHATTKGNGMIVENLLAKFTEAPEILNKEGANK